MGERKRIETIEELRKAIRAAKKIYVTARFGMSDQKVRINRLDALMLANCFPDDATPQEAEMPRGHFATVDAFGDLYLG